MLRRNKHQKKDENKTPDLGVKNKPKVSDFFRKILSSNP